MTPAHLRQLVTDALLLDLQRQRRRLREKRPERLTCWSDIDLGELADAAIAVMDRARGS